MQKTIITMSILILSLITINAQWMQTYGTRGPVVLWHVDDQVLYASIDSSRIYISENEGKWWDEANQGIPGNTILENLHAIGDTLFAATQGGGDGAGIYYSYNKGMNWSKAPGLPSTNYYFIDSFNGTVFASGYDFENQSLWYSNDYGQSWNAAPGVEGVSLVNDMTQNGSFLFASGYDYLYKSNDGGVNWTAAALNGIPDFTDLKTLTVLENDTVMATSGGWGFFNIYLSGDNGENWIQRNLNGYPDGTNLKNLRWINNELWAVMTNDSEGMTPAVVKSSDFGKTWNDVHSIYPHFPVLTSKGIYGISDEYHFLSTLNGIFRMATTGGDWGPANNGINYNGFVPSLAATNTHLFAYTSSRLFVSDDGEDWDTLAHASDYTSMQVLASQGNVILKDAYTIYYSTDNGGTWIDNSDQFPSEDDGFAFRTTISSGDYIIASAYMDGTLFYYSADGGVTWESFTFPGTYVATMSYSENTLFVSSDSIYSTSDFGDNWSIISRPGIENISNIGPFSKAGNRIIAHITTYTTKEVYYTEDNGATWIQAIDGLPDDYLINSMNFYNNILMATGDKGVFYSTDSAETWIELNDGFERRVNVYQPVIMDGYLYAGTFRDGVWKRSTDNILSVEVNGSVIPVDYNLKQNYPNPFNPTTTIEFSIPERSVIKLMIYNSIGQEIESIINEEIPAGNYKFNWDASQYSSGVYFYKLVSNNYSITKKALLLK